MIYKSILSNNLLLNQKKIFSLISSIVNKHPFFVVIILHEYLRNIEPHDPHIKFKIIDPKKRILKLQKQIIEFIKIIKLFGYYDLKFDLSKKNFLFETAKAFSDRNENVYLKGKYKIKQEIFKIKKSLELRFKNLNFPLKKIKNLKVLDAGCGPGRFTYVLGSYQPKKIYGLDLSSENIKIANKVFKRKNIQYLQGNVLKLPFKKESFDFVYSSGVIHHTSNFKKGLKELIRVSKKNGYIYLYIYADGGIYWRARATMNKIMKKIPQSYTQKVLDLIGMPRTRLLFLDLWYVPVEKHTSYKEIVKMLNKHGISKIKRVSSGAAYDHSTAISKYKKVGKSIWGEGDIRLLFQK
jgi:ubiquinone/menaquinone biosynthesis C-methylase UbiE|tara:strand:- start:18 stop:1073 length:1056 start_codon:yes stop_codon:yes gene_type:complete